MGKITIIDQVASQEVGVGVEVGKRNLAAMKANVRATVVEGIPGLTLTEDVNRDEDWNQPLDEEVLPRAVVRLLLGGEEIDEGRD